MGEPQARCPPTGTRREPCRGPRFERALFAFLLHAYPRPFRQRYGDELLRFFRADRALPRYAGAAGAWRFWQRTLRDLGSAALRERRSSLPLDPAIMLNDLIQDVRLALRMLYRERGFSVTAVLTLALGLGASTVIFSISSAALADPLPFGDLSGLVVVQGTTIEPRVVRAASYLEALDWAERTESLEQLSVYNIASVNLLGEQEAEQLTIELVDPSYFEILDVEPRLGRLFTAAENAAPEQDPVALISSSLWERGFGGDAAVLGGTLRLTGRDLVIIGVLPAGFEGLSLGTDVWAPTMMSSLVGRGGLLAGRSSRWLGAVARLRPGVGFEAAQADLDAVAAALAEEFPETNIDRTGTLLPTRDLYLGNRRDVLVVLMGAALGLLLVAAANVAGLLLVRTSGRHAELALRHALGSSRARIMRQLLTESMVVSSLGALVGVGVAALALPAIVASLPPGALPLFAQPQLGLRTLAFAVAALVATGLVAGTLPALRGSRADLGGALRGARTLGGGRLRGLSPRQLLVVAEVAGAFVLLIATGLMARTMAAKLAVEPGLDTANVSAFQVSLPAARYDAAATIAFGDHLLAELDAMAQVESATFGSDLPLRGDTSAGFLFASEASEDGIRYYRHRIAPGYLGTTGIHLLAGRDFSVDDTAESPRVALVSRELAQRLFRENDAVGRFLWLDGSEAKVPVAIVGVVDAVRWRDLTTDLSGSGSDPDLYLPFAQAPSRSVEFALRVRDMGDDLLPHIRRAVATVDPEIAVFQLTSLSELLQQQTASDRLASTVLAFFGGGALLLAGVGVYSVLAHSVGARRSEIAIRMALGATARRVRRRVVGEGLVLAVVGAGLGVGCSLLFMRLLSDLVFGVTAGDTLTHAAVVGVLFAVAFLATWLPAVRATRVQPHAALRAN